MGAILPVLLAAGLLLQDERPEGGGREGNLENKTSLPFAPDVDRLFSEGDARLAEGRFPAAIETWRRALVRSSEQEGWVAIDDRWKAGAREAFVRRAAALPPEARPVWASRAEGPAADALAAAGGDVERLSRLIEEHAGTISAARAALRLGDAAFERGEAASAAALYRIASCEGDDALRRSVLPRRASAAFLLEDRAEIERLGEEAAEAGTIEAGGSTQGAGEWLASLAGRLPAPLGPSSARLEPAWPPLPIPEEADAESPAGFDPRPAVAGGVAFFQTKRFLYACDLERGAIAGKVDLDVAVPFRGKAGEPAPLRRTRPAAAGALLALVHGEVPVSGGGGNALAVFERGGGPSESAGLRLLWARVPGGVLRLGDADGARDSRLDGFVFSEEPLLYGERLYCGLQRVTSEVASYLGCFDARTGELLFLRWLATGSEVDPMLARTRGRGTSNVAGSGPVASGGVVFYGTNLGVACALDARSGSCLFAYRTARRTPLEARENPRFADLALGRPRAGARGFAIAPGDSAFLYAFAFPAARGTPKASPLLHRPPSLRKAFLYGGWEGNRHLFLSNSGSEQTVAAVDPEEGRRIDSAPLGPDEAFLSPDTGEPREPALARGRLFAASERYLYAFDLGRELYMEAAIPPPIDPQTGLHRSGRVYLGNLVPAPGGILSATPRTLALYREERG